MKGQSCMPNLVCLKIVGDAGTCFMTSTFLLICNLFLLSLPCSLIWYLNAKHSHFPFYSLDADAVVMSRMFPVTTDKRVTLLLWCYVAFLNWMFWCQIFRFHMQISKKTTCEIVLFASSPAICQTSTVYVNQLKSLILGFWIKSVNWRK